MAQNCVLVESPTLFSAAYLASVTTTSLSPDLDPSQNGTCVCAKVHENYEPFGCPCFPWTDGKKRIFNESILWSDAMGWDGTYSCTL